MPSHHSVGPKDLLGPGNDQEGTHKKVSGKEGKATELQAQAIKVPETRYFLLAPSKSWADPLGFCELLRGPGEPKGNSATGGRPWSVTMVGAGGGGGGRVSAGQG